MRGRWMTAHIRWSALVSTEVEEFERVEPETEMDEPEEHGSVVVGIDGSTASLNAVRWAAREASAMHAPLRIVHVAPYRDPDPVFGAPDLDRDYGENALIEAAAAAVEAPDYPIIEPKYIQGNPVSVLRQEASAATMLVIGSVGIGILGSLVLGSTAAELAATAPCRVVVVKSHHLEHRSATTVATDTQPVVAVLTGAEDTWLEWDSIVAAATRAARLRDASVVVASSDDIDGPGGAGELSSRIDQWQKQVPGVRIDSVSQKGDLPGLALSLSQAAQLIVVGPPEHDRSSRLGIIGRTVHVLLHKSDSPVMIVRSNSRPEVPTSVPNVSRAKVIDYGPSALSNPSQLRRS